MDVIARFQKAVSAQPAPNGSGAAAVSPAAEGAGKAGEKTPMGSISVPFYFPSMCKTQSHSPAHFSPSWIQMKTSKRPQPPMAGGAQHVSCLPKLKVLFLEHCSQRLLHSGIPSR